jgi:hypothetical protein
MPANWDAFWKTPLILRPDITEFEEYLEEKEKRKLEKKKKKKKEKAKRERRKRKGGLSRAGRLVIVSSLVRH